MGKIDMNERINRNLKRETDNLQRLITYGINSKDQVREKLIDILKLMDKRSKEEKSKDFKEYLDFVGRLYEYSFFNTILIQLQCKRHNITPSLIASRKRWQKYGRDIKENARPIGILVPKFRYYFDFSENQEEPKAIPYLHHFAVGYVYDYSDTTGKPLPKYLLNGFKVKGKFNEKWLKNITKFASENNIDIIEVKESFITGGSIAREVFLPSKSMSAEEKKNYYKKDRYILRINQDLDVKSKFAVILHELAHLYLGHLGNDDEKKIKGRSYLDRNIKEGEAECVAYLVCKKLGLETKSAEYLTIYNCSEFPSLLRLITVSRDLEYVVRGKKKSIIMKEENKTQETKSEHIHMKTENENDVSYLRSIMQDLVKSEALL